MVEHVIDKVCHILVLVICQRILHNNQLKFTKQISKQHMNANSNLISLNFFYTQYSSKIVQVDASELVANIKKHVLTRISQSVFLDPPSCIYLTICDSLQKNKPFLLNDNEPLLKQLFIYNSNKVGQGIRVNLNAFTFFNYEFSQDMDALKQRMSKGVIESSQSCVAMQFSQAENLLLQAPGTILFDHLKNSHYYPLVLSDFQLSHLRCMSSQMNIQEWRKYTNQPYSKFVNEINKHEKQFFHGANLTDLRVKFVQYLYEIMERQGKTTRVFQQTLSKMSKFKNTVVLFAPN